MGDFPPLPPPPPPPPNIPFAIESTGGKRLKHAYPLSYIPPALAIFTFLSRANNRKNATPTGEGGKSDGCRGVRQCRPRSAGHALDTPRRYELRLTTFVNTTDPQLWDNSRYHVKQPNLFDPRCIAERMAIILQHDAVSTREGTQRPNYRS